jgi:UDP-GlcNAc:undecaprenyl-phosphate GlcNAc-1-phosphate transferase
MGELSGILMHYMPAAGLAFLVAFLSTPLAAAVARRLDVMDHPDQFLKPHARPTPYLGGVAIGVAWLLASCTALAWSGRLEPGPATVRLVPVLLGGLVVLSLGLADDVSNLRPGVRLAASAIVVGLVIGFSSLGLSLVQTVSSPLGWSWPTAAAELLSLPLGVFVVLGACNSTNLIDGLDGLCAGVVAVIAAGYALLAAGLLQERAGEPALAAALVLSLGVCGAALGFLPWNFQPARIFMGDAGSMLLGYNCGVLMLALGESGRLPVLLGAIVIFGLPLFDTVLAMFRRWRSGRPVFAGDRSHFYDQLVQRGLSVRQTAVLCYVVAALFAGVGLLIAQLSPATSLAAFLAVVLVAALLAWATGFARRSGGV